MAAAGPNNCEGHPYLVTDLLRQIHSHSLCWKRPEVSRVPVFNPIQRENFPDPSLVLFQIAHEEMCRWRLVRDSPTSDQVPDERVSTDQDHH